MRWTRPIAAVLIVGAVAVGLWLGVGPEPDPREAVSDAFEPDRVVVAVFDNRTGDHELDSLGELASDWIQNSLQDIVGLTVATNPYGAEGRGQRLPADGVHAGALQHLAEVTRSSLVVAGSYYQTTDQIEFQSRIVDPWRGEVLVAFDPVAGSRDDPSEAIGIVREEIAGALAAHFDAVIELGTERPVPLDAYREYRTAMDIWGSDYPVATDHLEKALEMAPDFHLARGMLCWAYKNQRRYADAHDEVQRLDQNPRGRGHARACSAALDGRWLDLLAVNREHVQQSPGVLWLKVDLGANAMAVNRPREAVEALETIPFDWISGESSYAVVPFTVLAAGYHLLGEYESQLRVARQCFEHFPDSVVFIGHQTDALAALGRLDEIGALVDRCLAVPTGVGDAGFTLRITAEELRAHGHRDRSMSLAERLVGRYGNRSGDRSWRHRVHLARVLIVAERWHEARNVLEGLARQYPEALANLGWLGVLAAKTGDRPEAERLLAELGAVDRPYLYGEHTYWRACITAHLGDHERAVDMLRDAFSQGKRYGIGLHRSMALEPLWDHPEFLELIAPKG
jgi:tetratricopeptide (TPR) repeat protein